MAFVLRIQDSVQWSNTSTHDSLLYLSHVTCCCNSSVKEKPSWRSKVSLLLKCKKIIDIWNLFYGIISFLKGLYILCRLLQSHSSTDFCIISSYSRVVRNIYISFASVSFYFCSLAVGVNSFLSKSWSANLLFSLTMSSSSKNRLKKFGKSVLNFQIIIIRSFLQNGKQVVLVAEYLAQFYTIHIHWLFPHFHIRNQFLM